MSYDRYGNPIYKKTYPQKVRFSDSLDLEPKTSERDAPGSIQSILADIEDIKVVLRKICDLCRTQRERIDSLSRQNCDQGSLQMAQSRPTLDEKLGLCLDKEGS